MYDVIIVGAGPAGSTAAKVLADKVLHVLLVERYKIPHYKSCSGVLIQKTMDLVRRYYGQAVPLSATRTPVENRGMIFTDNSTPSACSTAYLLISLIGIPVAFNCLMKAIHEYCCGKTARIMKT